MPPLARGIHRRTFFVVTDALRARFWKRTQRNSDGECWPWLGAQRNGYGAIKLDGKVVSAHVVSFVMHGGELAEGIIVTHSCDNRICVNPTHLVAGTPTSNVVEMHQRRGIPVACGVECYNAVLNDDLVRQIRCLAKENHWGEIRISRSLGLSESVVKGVLSGKNWKHVV